MHVRGIVALKGCKEAVVEFHGGYKKHASRNCIEVSYIVC